jgi:hypothetical protein
VRYIVLPIERDPVDAEEQGFEVFRAQFPGWQAADADPLTILVRATAVMDSEVAELASRMSEEAFRYFGRGLLGLPPVDDAPAIGTVRFTAQDASGPYVVPEDLEVAGRDATGTLRGFRVLSSAVIPNGSTTVDVAVEATEDGTVSEGISGAGEFLEYVDYLTAVEFIGTTEGATDRESDEAYLDRLAEELTLQAPRPIVPHDFAVLARRIAGPGYRATAIDGLNPADGTTDNERFVAVSLIDAAGLDAPAPVRTAVQNALEAMREATFNAPVFNPTRTTVDVTGTGTALPGWDPAAVEIAALERLADYLSPATWGQRLDTGETLEWRNIPLVRWGEVYEQLQRVEGLEFVDTLQLGKNGGALLASGADVTLDGYATLPVAGALSFAVSAGTP